MIFSSLLNCFTPLLDVISGTAPVTEAVAQAAATAAPAAAPVDDGGAFITNIVITLAFVAFMIFFMYYQPKKQQKAKQAMQDSLKIGDNVLTSAGFYGRIVDIGKDSFIVEFGDNRGVKVPVRKEAIEGIREPEL